MQDGTVVILLRFEWHSGHGERVVAVSGLPKHHHGGTDWTRQARFEPILRPTPTLELGTRAATLDFNVAGWGAAPQND